MANLRLLFRATLGEFDRAFAEMAAPIAAAATAAAREAGDELKAEARADIAAGGMSKRWQNAYRVNVYPKGGQSSIDAAAFGFHKIPYAAAFEEGASIVGRPRLWLPLSGTPKKIGRQKLTPELYRQKVGPLQYVARPGKAPLLMARQAAKSRSRRGGVSLSSLRRGAAGSGPTRSVPLFVGVDRVQLRKRFHIAAIAERIRGRLADLYVKHFGDD